MKKLVFNFYRFFKRVFVEIPKETLLLIKNRSLLAQPSYYPEKAYHKNKFQVFCDQVMQIIKHGAPEQFYYMYGFDTKKKVEINTYMHLNPYRIIRDQYNLSSFHNASVILRNKIYFGMFADFYGIKTGRNIGILEKGGIFVFDQKKIINIEEFCQKYDGSYFCKVLDGECGKGIFTLMLNKGDVIVNGELKNINYLDELFNSAQYLIQERVVQHSEMSRMYPSSLNTIRLVTIKNKKDGTINVFPSNLRIGAHGSFVDNGSQGGIGVGVHLDSGKLFEYGLQKPPYGTKTKTHPDTGVVFADFTIPFFKEAKEQAVFLHSKLDGIYSIGWDIAITEDGPLFIEGNDNWELQAIQRTHGGLKKELLESLGV